MNKLKKIDDKKKEISTLLKEAELLEKSVRSLGTIFRST